MTKTATRIWDPAEHLQSDEDMAAYLEAALEEGDASLFAAALGDIARAKGTLSSQPFSVWSVLWGSNCMRPGLRLKVLVNLRLK